MKQLCHDIRNGTANIHGLIKKLNDLPLRIEILTQLKRIEKALIAYELRTRINIPLEKS